MMHDILDWYDLVAGDVDRLLIVQSADKRAQKIAAEHRYVFDTDDGSEDGDWIQFNQRELFDLQKPKLPEGFRFRTANEISLYDAVKVHQNSWQSTAFTEAALEQVQRTPPYQKDLHLFVEAPNGLLVATAIIWLDMETSTAEFELVGTHVDFQRLGMGRALQLHGMIAAKGYGAEQMFVACQGSQAHPAAKGLYLDVGFRKITRDLPLVKVFE